MRCRVSNRCPDIRTLADTINVNNIVVPALIIIVTAECLPLAPLLLDVTLLMRV